MPRWADGKVTPTTTPGNPRVVVRDMSHAGQPAGRSAWVWCPGCKQPHIFDLVGLDGSKPYRGIEWTWDGNLEAPTFQPSMLAFHSVHLCPEDYEHYEVCEDPDGCGERGHAILNMEGIWADAPPEDERILGHMLPHVTEPAFGPCHSFLHAGRWQFLGDSTHELAGQTVDLPPLPDYLVR